MSEKFDDGVAAQTGAARQAAQPPFGTANMTKFYGS
jgi:hypothetical protein